MDTTDTTNNVKQTSKYGLILLNFKNNETFYDSLEMVKRFEYICFSKFCFVFMEKNGISRLISFFHYIVLHENIPPSQRLDLKH